ncbi:MAG: flagellar biosynthesis anti-sigma factor FlgM [Planctomycetaceae bacterium]|nr:flagellar biosynthesis anti-sigma factor FlgM [Planctomycetaceae bacterium]
MQIYGASHVHGPQSISQPHGIRPSSATAAGGSSAVTDELHISSAAQFIDQANQLPEIRQERVDAIRQAIADGTYETADKLDAALENLLNEIA